MKNHKSFARRLYSGFLAFCMMFTMASTSMAAYAEELDGEQQPAVISAVEEETAETVQGEQEVDEENPLEEPVPDGQAEEPAVTATPETAQEPLPDLAILDQSAGEQQVPVGEMADLRVELNRDDVAVEYQWQKLSDPGEETTPGFELFSYAEDAPCTYAYLIDDMSETEWLSENPDASWSGIELYFAVADALDAIGEDCSDVQIVNGTENFALEGYALSAVKTEEGVRVFADLEDSHYSATLNGEGKWQFSQGTVDAAEVWQDIDGAAQAVYSHEVTESDAWTLYRCRITITDEAYLAESLARLEEQGVELSENALDAEQVLVSSTFRILPDGWEECESDETENGEIGFFSTFASLFSAPSGSSGIGISADTQWITGITGDYEYLSKETYDRIHGQVTAEQESRYWTKIGGDFSKTYTANVLDRDGMPTGRTRTYRGFALTDNKLEVNSDWYGKTVYFRLQGSTGTGTAIEVPAYTSLNGAAGQTYKKAITVLNPYVRDSGTVYLNFLSSLNRSFTYADDTHIRIYSINCETFNADPNQFLMDAEGSYRMDSVAWGVNTELEPDLSGKAYWALKSYLGEGYGLMIGHDTLYAYAGSYYDAYGTDFDESSIDPNDTSTHYYAVNSWRPNDGHWRMNQLMGSNAGNVYAGNVDPSRTASGIISSGGSHGQYGKTLMLGNDQLRIVTDGYSASLAAAQTKYRTPTNYPYSFAAGQIVTGSLTHTNGQIAFGKVWVEYNGQGSVFADIGCVSAPVAFTVKGRTGTNNFYLSGDGNFLMNQIGHLPDNSAHADEVRVKAREYYSPDVQEYGYLANITSEAEQNYFYNQAQIKAPNSNGWLGGYRDGLTWKWADGPEAGTAWFQQTSDVTDGGEWGWWHIGGSAINGMYNHWNSGEPNDTHFRDCQGEPYLHYWGNLGTWNDYPVNASDVYAMIVEFGGGTKQTITAVTHCVEDKDRIGTQLPAALSPEITVFVSDESKVYDGTELMPHIVVSSSEVTNPAQYVLATYSCSTASAGYSGRTLAASAGSGNGCINAGSYKVTLTLTQAAINAGYGFSADSVTTAALTIHQRPVTIESNDNNKVYDGSDSAVIRNIRIVSGVVNGDTVTLNTTSLSGTYDSKHTGTWNITPGSTVSLDTNPYQNYFLAGASYSGSITARPLAVHSRYLEDAASPRNVKTYDGSDAAVISNIRVDNIVPGDSVWINKQSFAGTYATANAGETLTADGKAQPDRWLHLAESEITRSAQDAIFLVNDPFSDYCIASESYSGAIARAMLTAQLKGWKNLYGEGMQEVPWADEIYEVDKASDSWLKLEGLRGNDVLVIDPGKSRFEFDLLPMVATHVGVYPISYDGLNETNYPVLSNYIVGVLSNTLEVVARKIAITPDDIDRVTTSSWAPLHSSFAMELADGSYTELGTDSSLGYSCMNLIGDDTVFSMLRVKDANGQSQELSMPGYQIFGNIPYDTECTIHSPARYLQEHHAAADYKRCDFCEEYFDFVDGTEHADLAGYELRINRDTESGSTLSVVACENFYGELVEDYELVYGTGTIVVHPWARVQLEVTVPLNVCMYGYGGDGEVVEPTNYTITNYSNCNVHITNIRTGDGWELTEEPSRAGQMALQLQSTQLANGDNNTARQAPWIISHADRLAGSSVELPVEVRARIAPGVNDAGETMATHAEYTVEIYIRDP